MTKVKTKIGRRSFIRRSGLAGGGLVLGFNWLASCNMSPEQVKTLPKEWFEINGFLKIGDNGLVTIMSPNPEIGQNVKTAMPMIIAEELDVNWEDVIVEQAPLNTEIFTRQLAGGSQSIRQGWESLRMTGATARQMLVNAAAQHWEVPADEIETSNGELKHASKKNISYGEVASLAAKVEVPEEVELKSPKDFTIIGTDRFNVDGKKIVMGEPLFGLDTDIQGMKIAMPVLPDRFGAKFKEIVNADEVKNMPGIIDVFPVDVYPEGSAKQWSDSGGNDQIVAIVGESTWQCMQAKKAINVKWDQESPAESTSHIQEQLLELLNKAPDEPAREDGNVHVAFRSAAKIVESTYTAPYLAHNTMEPMNFFANVTDDKAELLGPIQTPEFLEMTLASVLGMPAENIDIQMTRMGGGFGRRLYGAFAVEAARISQKLKAPVKLIYTREDDMEQGTYRPSYMVRFKAGLDEEGNLTAWQVRGVGTNDSLVFENRFPAGAVDNYLAEKSQLNTNITTGAWRAPRSNFIAGAEQAFMDEVAEAAGKDPIEFRLALFDRAINDPVGDNNDYDASRYAGVLELVKEKSSWNDDNSKGRGVAAYYCHNSYVAQVIEMVEDAKEPRVGKVWCAVDCGIVVNPLSAKNQIEGGIVDGIGHGSYSGLTFEDGRPEQNNFHQYRLIRNSQAPLEVETFFVDNGIDPTGLGEPSLPPVIGTLANALYRSTGRRYYNQPFLVETQPDAIAQS